MFLDAVGARADARVFLVGSVLFTVAAALQWLETINADPAVLVPARGVLTMLLGREPRRIDWWSSGVQLAGTPFFNVSTFRALSTAVDSASYNQVVWRPDAFGSICFLVSGYLAYVEVAGGLLRRPHASLEGVLRVGQPPRVPGLRCLGRRGVRRAVDREPGRRRRRQHRDRPGCPGVLVGSVLLLPEGSRSLSSATRVR